MNEAEVRAKLRKIEALFARAETEGERLAAEAAAERIRARLGKFQKSEGPIEMKFSLPDAWSRQLFVALSRRYGLKPYRYPRQRRTTVVLSAPERFISEPCGPSSRSSTRGVVKVTKRERADQK